MNKRLLVIVIAVVLVVLLGVFVLLRPEPVAVVVPEIEPVENAQPAPTSTVSIIGTSVEGREIEAHTFGNGGTNILFVGGVHGGYEWNSVLLAYEFIDYFNTNPNLIPEGLSVSIIPNLNPDAVYEITGTDGRFAAVDIVATSAELADARFNANNVDLNRNFDCKWAPESTWRGQTVSAGEAAFSEPETAALKAFVIDSAPEAVIFWHSQANTVYASECEAGVLPETLTIMETYAAAAKYNTQASFDAYSITGDAEGWLASINIPAITVELETHESIDWNRNVSGVSALLNYYDVEMAR